MASVIPERAAASEAVPLRCCNGGVVAGRGWGQAVIRLDSPNKPRTSSPPYHPRLTPSPTQLAPQHERHLRDQLHRARRRLEDLRREYHLLATQLRRRLARDPRRDLALGGQRTVWMTAIPPGWASRSWSGSSGPTRDGFYHFSGSRCSGALQLRGDLLVGRAGSGLGRASSLGYLSWCGLAGVAFHLVQLCYPSHVLLLT
jgi:hypothetical protein